MKVTADTITDEQIRELLTDKEFLEAKEADRPPWRTQLYCINRALKATTRTPERTARARCAEMLKVIAGGRK